MNDKELIERNVRIHNRINRKYDNEHPEIFNPIEQERLRDGLDRALSSIKFKKDGVNLNVMDYGCGSGNLAVHLSREGVDITLADISEKFLEVAKNKIVDSKVSLLQLNGKDISEIKDEVFDFVGCYSVLHHIPDYLFAITEMARICKKGGVVFMDHERSPSFWNQSSLYKDYLKAPKRIDFKKYLSPMNYVHKFIRIFNPKHANEGDIHVWPDDHIEWDKITDLLENLGFEIVVSEDYLNYNHLYSIDTYEKHKELCEDTRLMIFRKM